MFESIKSETWSLLLVLIIFTLLVLCAAAFYNSVVIPFSKKRNYIKMEIYRSDNREAYKYWKRKLRQHYISYIPIFGRIVGSISYYINQKKF